MRVLIHMAVGPPDMWADVTDESGNTRRVQRILDRGEIVELPDDLARRYIRSKIASEVPAFPADHEAQDEETTS